MSSSDKQSPVGPGFSTWLPFGSAGFWIGFVGAGGAIAAILAAQGVASAPVIAAVAIVIGWLCGVVAAAVGRARRGTMREGAGETGYIGASGTVTGAIPENGGGRVRIEHGGKSVDVDAIGEYSSAVPSGAGVRVVGQGEDGRVVVRR